MPFNFTCTNVEFLTTCSAKNVFELFGFTLTLLLSLLLICMRADLYEVQVSVIQASPAHGVVLRRLVEAQVHQQLAALQRRAHLGLVRLPVAVDCSSGLKLIHA